MTFDGLLHSPADKCREMFFWPSGQVTGVFVCECVCCFRHAFVDLSTLPVSDV